MNISQGEIKKLVMLSNRVIVGFDKGRKEPTDENTEIETNVLGNFDNKLAAKDNKRKLKQDARVMKARIIETKLIDADMIQSQDCVEDTEPCEIMKDWTCKLDVMKRLSRQHPEGAVTYTTVIFNKDSYPVVLPEIEPVLKEEFQSKYDKHFISILYELP